MKFNQKPVKKSVSGCLCFSTCYGYCPEHCSDYDPYCRPELNVEKTPA